MPLLDGHWLYLVILLAIVLIIKGPGKLPEIGAGIGRAINEFKRASSESKPVVPETEVQPSVEVSGTPQQHDAAVKSNSQS